MGQLGLWDNGACASLHAAVPVINNGVFIITNRTSNDEKQTYHNFQQTSHNFKLA